MQFFLDTALPEEVRQAASWGILDGVTTNPSHLAKVGRPVKDVVLEICDLVDGPISVEVVSTDLEGMLREAHLVAGWHPNVVVKIPMLRDGVRAIRALSSEGVRTNATLIFSAVQATLIAKAGATYASPFVGRLDATGANGIDVISEIRAIYDQYGFGTRILAAALRHPRHVLEAALAGADVATMSFAILDALFEHPLTDTGLAQFLGDWKEAGLSYEAPPARRS